MGRKVQRHTADTLIHDHSAGQTSVLMRQLALQASRTARLSDGDAIHDLRVSIRRLAQCLRVFGQFFPRERVKKFPHRLRTLMDLASAVRDRDIALELLAAARIPFDSALTQVLSEDRAGAERSLVGTLERWSRRGFQ